MKTTLTVIGGVIVAGAAIFLIALFGFGMDSFFQPKYTALQYNTFKKSQSHNEGMAQQLAEYRIQYLTTKSQEAKDAIRSTVQEQYASYDDTQLPSDLRDFLNQMKGV